MNAKTNANKVWKIVSKQKAVIAILGLMLMMLFFDTTFYTMYNWLDMLRSTAILEIVAFGVTVAVICGGCDLSVGGTLCLGGIIAVMMVNSGQPIWLAFLLALKRPGSGDCQRLPRCASEDGALYHYPGHGNAVKGNLPADYQCASLDLYQ